MSECFQFINFDKHQSRSGKGRLTGDTLVRNLSIPKAFPKLEDVFTKIFSYDIPTSNVLARTTLGRLDKLPVELIADIFDLSDLDEALALAMAHSWLFVIGYPSIITRLKDTYPAVSITNWSYDRIICLGGKARKLPESYLSLTERLGLMKWSIKHRKVINHDPALDKINHKVDSKDLTDAESREIKQKLAAYKDQSFDLNWYSASMPSANFIEEKARWYPYSLMFCRRDGIDYHRISVLKREVVWFDPHKYDLRTLIFVNVSKREYVRAVDSEGYDALDAAIPLLTIWGEDESTNGEWAGDRLAIIPQDIFEERLRRGEKWTEKEGRWEWDL